jgi:hypothetical protein
VVQPAVAVTLFASGELTRHVADQIAASRRVADAAALTLVCFGLFSSSSGARKPRST